LPIINTFTLTVHKVQGLSLPPCSQQYVRNSMFAEGQAYVGLSRATTVHQAPTTPASTPSSPAPASLQAMI
ncbi:hypothetical protein B0J14DRAFT_496942, partial [Halenospora varia]